MENIRKIAYSLSLKEEDLVLYGDYKAKIKKQKITEILKYPSKAKTVLVASSAAQEEYRTSIGIADALNLMNRIPVLCLCEPPIGNDIESGVIPSDEINLHFTGDFHAVETANNMIAEIVDEHIIQGNEFGIKEVVWKRCSNLINHSSRKIYILDGSEIPICPTVESEMMAILCSSNSVEELSSKINSIIVGYNILNYPVFFGRFDSTEAVVSLLSGSVCGADCPNLVQTVGETPTFIHGNPIYGGSSALSMKLAQRLGRIVITETDDVEKFIDINTRRTDADVDCIVIALTPEYLRNNFESFQAYADNLKKTNIPIVAAINKPNDNSEEDIAWVKDKLNSIGIPNEISLGDSIRGGDVGVANLVLDALDEKNEMNRYYEISDSIRLKIEKVAREVYGINSVKYSEKAEEKLKTYRLLEAPVCIMPVKTFEKNKELDIIDLEYYCGAGLIVVYVDC